VSLHIATRQVVGEQRLSLHIATRQVVGEQSW
jgi:hypothetical protein